MFNRERLEDGSEFSIIADASLLQPKVQTESADPQPSTSNTVAEASSGSGTLHLSHYLIYKLSHTCLKHSQIIDHTI